MANPTKKEQSIITAAIKRLDVCVKAEDHNRKAALEDLRFLNGEQWDAGEKKRRSDKGRPALQFNMLPKFVDQVVGDMLHNSPSIKVRPVDSKADVNIAKIRQGIISNIEYLSNSKAVYGYGAKQMVSSGFGGWRVLTRYTEENPFIQEAYLEAVRNPFLIYLDPTSKDQNYADAKYGFILEKMTKEELKERYPKAKYPTAELKSGSGLAFEHWFDGETVTVAEYFTVESETRDMVQLEDGRVVTEEKFKEIHDEWKEKHKDILQQLEAPAPEMGQEPPQSPVGMAGGAPVAPPQSGLMPQSPSPAPPMQPPMTPPNPLAKDISKLGKEPKVAKKRTTEEIVIRQRILTCMEILEGGEEGTKFPGKFIPLVLLKGKELNIEGKNYVYSLIRHAKDSQKMLNYWQCLDVNTPIPTPYGWSTMGDLEVGDKVFGDDGKVCRVLGTSPLHEGRDCYRVTFSDGSMIIADDSHRWRVERTIKRNSSGLVREAKTVTTTELIAGSDYIYYSKPLELDFKDLPIHPYTLGVWLGDGSTASGKITCGVKDIDSLTHNLTSVGETLSVTFEEAKNIYTIRIVGLTSKLRAITGLTKKFIPAEYLRSSLGQRLELLRGLMDTDGSIAKHNYQCSFTTTLPELASGFSELLSTLGIKSKEFARKGRVVNFGEYSSNGKDATLFHFTAPEDMVVFALDRKVAVQTNKIKYDNHRTKRFKVVDVSPVESVTTKCIAVDNESHLFLAGWGMVPTHNTAAAETIALAPKAPWLGTAKQFEGYENDYASANVDNFPFLKYNFDPEAPGPPQRQQPGQPPVAIFQMIAKGEDNIKSSIGLFNADVGAAGSEQTGAAIIARQRPGDIGTFEFSENLARAVCYTGKILNSIIPEIYDTERDVRLRNIDETETFVPINTTVKNALKSVEKSPEMFLGMDVNKLKETAIEEGEDARFNDVTEGKYDVVVTTGPSYATQRQESAQTLMQMTQAMPEKMGLAADLIVQNMDFKDADELAARLRKTLPPGMAKPRPGEQQTPQPPNPAQIAAQAKMAEVQAKQQMAQLKLKQEELKLQEQQIKLQIEIAKAQKDLGKEVDTRALDEAMAQIKIDQENRRIALEEARFEHQRGKDIAEHAHKRNMEGGKLALEAAKGMQQAWS